MAPGKWRCSVDEQGYVGITSLLQSPLDSLDGSLSLAVAGLIPRTAGKVLETQQSERTSGMSTGVHYRCEHTGIPYLAKRDFKTLITARDVVDVSRAISGYFKR